MAILYLILAGLAGGLIGGMGMGGGTLLIPILTLLLGIGQHTAQSINLLSFIPMSIISLIVHMKHKLIEYKTVLYIAAGGVLFSVLGAYLASGLDRHLLRMLFGGFIILVGAVQIVALTVKAVKRRRQRPVKVG